ncbi:MAG: hypothetical protein WCJ96_11075, partial [Verrucomicrobiota bacterium]
MNSRWNLIAACFIAASAASAQDNRPVAGPRVSISAGLSVAYVRAKDLTDMANATPGAAESVPSFKTAAEFFASFSVPISGRWGIKCEYAYFLASYSIPTSGGTGTAEYGV